MKKIFIYILIDPRKPEVVRYVGQTETPRTRHIQHCCESGRSSKNEWIELLRQEGFMPQMVIVEETSPNLADKAERIWIERFKASGVLSNTIHCRNTRLSKSALNVGEVMEQVRKETGETLSVLAEVEKAAIVDALTKSKGNKSEAQKNLGIGRQTLYNKIKLYNITV